MNKSLVVKLGTNAMTNEDGSLNDELIRDLVRQISVLRKEYDVLLVTSGAMGSGRSVIKKELKYDPTTNRQIYAVVGQVKLMEMYHQLFAEHGIIVAQMLATKQDFENRNHLLNTKNCIDSLFKEGIIPIMNENDFVCIEELMFTDNDELAGIVAGVVRADSLVILSNVDGVYDKDGGVFSHFGYDDLIPDHIVSSDKSSFGKGGMHNKFKMAQSAAQNGIHVVIANSKAPDVLLRVVNGDSVGTRFLAKQD